MSEQEWKDRVVRDIANVQAAQTQMAAVQRTQGLAIDELVQYHRESNAAREARKELAKSVVSLTGKGGGVVAAVLGAAYALLESLGVLR